MQTNKRNNIITEIEDKNNMLKLGMECLKITWLNCNKRSQLKANKDHLLKTKISIFLSGKNYYN